MGLDAVPEERHKDQVVADYVGDATAKLRARELLSQVQYNNENCQRYAEV